MLTQERLKELMNYDPDRGLFTWKVNRGYVKAGSIAGGLDSKGYVRIRVEGTLYIAHRLAFLWMEGYLPENGVDHKDRIRHNNWWENLREASNQCNLRNTGNYCCNTSGVKGICWYKKYNKWEAYIVVNRKSYHLGYFTEFEEAAYARLAAEQCLNWSRCDSKSPAQQFIKNLNKGVTP